MKYDILILDDIVAEGTMNLEQLEQLDKIIRSFNNMTTQAITPDVNASNASNATVNNNFTTEREDVVVGFNITKDSDGKEIKSPAIYVQGEAVQKLVTEGKFKEEYAVATVVNLPKTMDALVSLYKTAEEQEEGVANHNRGVRQKLTNRRNASLLAQDDEGNFTFNEAKLTNGAFDLTPEIASPSKRKTLSEEEKLDRFLEQFPEAVRNSMKAAYQGAKAAPVAA